MSKASSAPRPRVWLGALAAGLALAACGAAPGSGATPGPTPRPGGPVALVHGPVDSPVFDELKRTFRVVQYNGSQKAADHDILVFDGDAHEPAALQKDPLVAEAARASKWVVGVDLRYAHKRYGLGERAGFSTQGASGVYAVLERRENNTPTVRVLNMPLSALAAGAGSPDRPGAAEARAFARDLAGRLRAPGAAPQAVGDTDTIPGAGNGLLAKSYYYTVRQPAGLGGPSKPNQENTNSQTGSAQYDYTFNVYLDQSNPQGNFQWVAAELDVVGNPTAGSGVWACNACYTGHDSDGNADEYAWFLDRQTVSLRPVPDDTRFFSSYNGGSPATTNNVEQVTTSLSFTIGFQALDGAGTAQYQTSQTRNIADWKLTNNSSGNLFSWYYRSNNPLDADGQYICIENDYCNPIFGTDKDASYPQQPNDISMSQLQLHAAGLWKTSQVLDRWATFLGEGVQGYADVWCPKDAWIFGCEFYDSLNSPPVAARKDFNSYHLLELNLASVVPIPIAFLAFSPNPVKLGSAATGTLTLTRPAVEDTDILLKSSNPQVATVPPTVTVSEGQTTATFSVQTNSTGGGTPSGATIQAVYANGAQAELSFTP